MSSPTSHGGGDVSNAKVLIVDFGSQFAKKFPKVAEGAFVRTVLLSPAKAGVWAATNEVRAIILTGGDKSVYDDDSPQLPDSVRRLIVEGKVPTLAVCYGMQLIAQTFGGKVANVLAHREYGKAGLNIMASQLFQDLPASELPVWSSHGDSVVTVPTSYRITARSSQGGIAAMENDNGTVFCVQFHPEVQHTACGQRIIENFLLKIAHCEKDWSPENLSETIVEETMQEVGNERVIAGFSGGVDSTTAAKLFAERLGDRFLGVTLDCGHLREGEVELARAHAAAAGIQHEVIDCRAFFADAFSRTMDAEEERKIFSDHYVDTLIRKADVFGAKFVLQGTLAPDLIESGKTGGALIKTHHNGDNDFQHLIQLHPLRHLFKHEVRAIARQLDLPQSVWGRKPAPGPCLFLRIFGTNITMELLDVVRWADARVTEILTHHGLFDEVDQLVVAYDGSKATCVKGDARAYLGSIVVRAVQSQDFMTANAIIHPADVTREITDTLGAHSKIGRVFFDYSNKPPGTIEFK